MIKETKMFMVLNVLWENVTSDQCIKIGTDGYLDRRFFFNLKATQINF
jgi:hypothetical protein